jgi:hypothetical protein
LRGLANVPALVRVQALKELDEEAMFRFLGGDLMVSVAGTAP